MGHRIIGLVAAPKLLDDFARAHGLHEPVPLRLGLHFLPLEEAEHDIWQPTGTPTIGKFTYLSESLAELLKTLSRQGTVLYLETDYFGGLGGQSALLFGGGAAIFGPNNSDDTSISEALRMMGVKRGADDFDEFDAVGLGAYRSNEDWLKNKGIPTS